MKSLLVLIAIVVIVSTVAAEEKKPTQEDHHKFLKRIAQECSDEGGFEFENAMKLILGDFSDRSEKAQCFMSCFFKKEGFVGEDGAPDIEFIVNALANSVSFEREKLHKIIEKCATLPSKDQCDAAYKLLECYTNTVKDLKPVNKS